jgi:DNA-binding response OmpR family regulator
VSRDDTEESLQALASGFDDLIRKPIREDFTWERGDVHSSGFVLEYVAKCLKI